MQEVIGIQIAVKTKHIVENLHPERISCTPWTLPTAILYL